MFTKYKYFVNIYTTMDQYRKSISHIVPTCGKKTIEAVKSHYNPLKSSCYGA
jgi:hypothetical protein